jgi:non-ribosomal peptide synthetase component F
VWEIFGPLLAGVPSVIVPQEALLDPEELIGYLARHGVTRMVLVPSLLRALLDHAPNLGERLPKLKLWSLSGEALPWELAGRFQKAFPQATLLNIYGSSEVAADVTWHEVTERAEEKTGTVPIGRPISNTQVYVLDRYRNPVPVGVRGEIYVGGAGLGAGVLATAGVDGRAVCGEPDRAGEVGTVVQDGGSGTVAEEWRDRVSGEDRQ